MYGIRYLSIAALIGAAATGAAQYGDHAEPVLVPAVAPRGDNCAELPKLCTDQVMLHRSMTTITYLCPEKTASPSTVTVTETATTTVTEELPTSASPASTSCENATVTEVPTTTITVSSTTQETSQIAATDEPTTTITVSSTTQVTVTREVIQATQTFTAVPITWSYTAILPSDQPNPTSNTAVPPSDVLIHRPSYTAVPITWSYTAILPSGQPISASTMDGFTGLPSSFDLFPSHTTINSSSATYASVTSASVLVASTAPLFSNSTSQTGHNAPTMNFAREAKSTEVVTSTLSTTPTTSSKGEAGENRVSFVALICSLMVVAFIA